MTDSRLIRLCCELDPYIPSALLTIIDKAVYASCDDADGVKDSLIRTPRGAR